MEKNRHTASELALLAIFAASLFFAAVLTSWKNRIAMSEPMILDFAGITASIPKGGHWRGSPMWRYYKPENNFILASSFVQDEVHAAFAELTYIFTPATLDPVSYINSHLVSGTEITAKGRILQDGIELIWRQVKPSDLNAVLYVAAARLPADRLLYIKIFAYRNVVSAEKVFMSVTKKLRFERSEELEKGIQFVGHLKDKGVVQLIRKETGPGMSRIYLVNRTAKVKAMTPRQRTFDGFVVEHFKEDYNNSDMPVRCSSFFLMTGADGAAADTLFQSDLRFDRFVWKSRHATPDGDVAGIIQIELDESGALSYTNLYAEPELDVMYPSSIAIPEILVDAVATELLEYPAEAVVVDVIFGDGRILPVRLSTVKPADLNADLEDIAFAVKIQYLHHAESRQIVYFDRKRAIIAKLEGKNMPVVGYRAGLADLLNAFGDWTEHINTVME